MSLSVSNCNVGAIVDHRWEHREDGKTLRREVVRRGIIVKVNGNGADSVSEVWAKFKLEDEPEKVNLEELDLFCPAGGKVAREAYRRVMGLPRHVGAEFSEKKSPSRSRVQDAMAVSPRPVVGPVMLSEEDQDDEIGGMNLENTGA